MDLDLRRARSFLVVADELHFGRAAERLHVAQPALSRRVAALERELGVRLLDRSTRHVELTAAGASFLADIGPVLAAADEAIRRLRHGQRGGNQLIVGFMPGLTPRTGVRAVMRQFPGATIEMRELIWTTQADMVRDGTVDVAVIRQPIDSTGLRVQHLVDDPRGVLLPIDHPHAMRRSLRISDLANYPVIRHRYGGIWDDYWTVNPRPDGTTPIPGPVVETVPEKLEIVANGAAITFLPRSASRAYIHPEVRWVPITDIEDSHVALAWATGRRGRLMSAFVAALAASPSEVIGGGGHQRRRVGRNTSAAIA